MILSNEGIKEYMKRGIIRITPPPSEEQIGQASVDLTLSNEFWKFKKNILGKKLDVNKIKHSKITEKVISEKEILHPKNMILGKTLEKIKIPNDILGRLEGRSRYARFGLAVHITSALIQPGSNNHQILEIVNLSPFSIILRPGMRISQVVFERLENPTTKPYAKFGRIAKKQ